MIFTSFIAFKTFFKCVKSMECQITSDGTINLNRVSEISGVFLESESKAFDLLSDLTNDFS